MTTGVLITVIVVGGIVAITLIGTIKEIVGSMIAVRHIKDIEESAKKMAELLKSKE